MIATRRVVRTNNKRLQRSGRCFESVEHPNILPDEDIWAKLHEAVLVEQPGNIWPGRPVAAVELRNEQEFSVNFAVDLQLDVRPKNSNAK